MPERSIPREFCGSKDGTSGTIAISVIEVRPSSFRKKEKGPTSLGHTAANPLALSHFRNAIVSSSHADIIHCV